MAKRIHKIETQEHIKSKIQGLQLARLVQEYALTGKFNNAHVEPKRVDAALGLLKKLIPDLSSTELKAQITSYTETLDKIAALDQAPVSIEQVH